MSIIYGLYCESKNYWKFESRSGGRKSKRKKKVEVKAKIKVGAVHSPAIFSIQSDTTGVSKTCDPNFTSIGHKLFIFPSPTWFQKISLRSEVKQVPLSYQLRSEIKALGTERIYFTELHCSSLIHPFLVPSASLWPAYDWNIWWTRRNWSQWLGKRCTFFLTVFKAFLWQYHEIWESTLLTE